MITNDVGEYNLSKTPKGHVRIIRAGGTSYPLLTNGDYSVTGNASAMGLPWTHLVAGLCPSDPAQGYTNHQGKTALEAKVQARNRKQAAFPLPLIIYYFTYLHS